MADLVAPASLRVLQPFLRRAEECDRTGARNPEFHRISYFIRLATVTIGCEARAKVPPAGEGEADAFLEALVSRLEADKVAAGVVKENEAADMELVRNYALTIFKRADDIDRAGAADASTASGFVAAANLLDVLRALGAVDPQLAGMCKYAKSRAVEIAKAAKEGRVPEPPRGGVDVGALLGGAVGDAGSVGAGGAGGAGASGGWVPPDLPVPPTTMPVAGAGAGQASWAAPAPPAPASRETSATVPVGARDEAAAGVGAGGPAQYAAQAPQQFAHAPPQQQQQQQQMPQQQMMYGTPPPQLPPPLPPQPSFAAPQQQYAAAPQAAPAPAVPAQQPRGAYGAPAAAASAWGQQPPAGGPTPALFDDALEFTRHAVAALKERDAPSASNFLRRALALVEGRPL